MHFVPEGRRTRRPAKRDPRGANVASGAIKLGDRAPPCEEERGDMHVVPEGRRTRRLAKRDPRGANVASGAIKLGAAEPTCWFASCIPALPCQRSTTTHRQRCRTSAVRLRNPPPRRYARLRQSLARSWIPRPIRTRFRHTQLGCMSRPRGRPLFVVARIRFPYRVAGLPCLVRQPQISLTDSASSSRHCEQNRSAARNRSPQYPGRLPCHYPPSDRSATRWESDQDVDLLGAPTACSAAGTGACRTRHEHYQQDQQQQAKGSDTTDQQPSEGGGQRHGSESSPARHHRFGSRSVCVP